MGGAGLQESHKRFPISRAKFGAMGGGGGGSPLDTALPHKPL